MRRALIGLVVPVLTWMLSACGGAQAPEVSPPSAGEKSAEGGEVCPTGDPSTQPCPEGCKWDEKVMKCMKDRGIIVEYGAPPPPPPPPPAS